VSEFGRRVFCEGEEIQGLPRLSAICGSTAHVDSPISAVSVCRIANLRKFQRKIGNYCQLVRLCRGQTHSRVRLCGVGQSRGPGSGDAQTAMVREYGRAVRRYLDLSTLTILLVLRGISTKPDWR
jgi:hypothetical protein